MESHALINLWQDELEEFKNLVYSNPEVGFQEFKAVAAFTKVLSNHKIKCHENYCGIPTAFRAESGSGEPTIGILAEYDALPMGHACGHHLIATAALSAFLAATQLAKAKGLKGKIVLIGAPAEETFGGKIELLKKGGFDNLDCVLISHPYYCNAIDNGALAVSRFDVSFHGRAAHAAAAPEQGLNALDAMRLLFQSIDCFRQQMPKDTMIHGIITNGGELPNIIPSRTNAFFYLRALSDCSINLLEKRFRNMVKGASLMTGCRGVCRKRANAYSTSKLNPVLNTLIRELMEQINLPIQPISEHISTDFADVSKKIPGANFFFQAVESPSTAALHTLEFLNATAKPYAFEQSLKSGAVIAQATITMLSDTKLLASIKNAYASDCSDIL